MKFHGITMKGDFKAQTVVDASALVWGASDERRIVYDQTTNQIWLADGSKWKTAGQYGDIPAGEEMWFYADSAWRHYSIYEDYPTRNGPSEVCILT